MHTYNEKQYHTHNIHYNKLHLIFPFLLRIMNRVDVPDKILCRAVAQIAEWAAQKGGLLVFVFQVIPMIFLVCKLAGTVSASKLPELVVGKCPDDSSHKLWPS